MSKQITSVQAERERYHDCLAFLQQSGVSLEGKTICQADLHLIVPLSARQTSYDVQIIQNQLTPMQSQDQRQKTLAQQDLFYATSIGYMIEIFQPNIKTGDGNNLGYGTYLTGPSQFFQGADDPDFNNGVANLWAIDQLWNNLTLNANVSNTQVIRGISGSRFRYIPQTYYNWVPSTDPTGEANLLTMQEADDGFLGIVPGLVVDGSISTILQLVYSSLPPEVGLGDPTSTLYKQWNAHVFLRGFNCMNCASTNAGSEAAKVLMALEAAKGGLPGIPVVTPMGTVVPGMQIQRP